LEIRISRTLIRAAKDAAIQMFRNNERLVFLEPPFDGFYVSAEILNEEDCFKIFTPQELQINGEEREIYLYCENIWGKKTREN